MNPIGIVLVGISCISHSSWNLLAKRNVQQGDFFWWMLVMLGGVLAVPAVIGLWLFPLPGISIALAGGSAVFVGIYFASLSMSYRRGDMSIIYPLARAAPLFLLALSRIFVGVHFDIYGYVGIGLVIIGAVILPMFTGNGWGRWLNSGNLWAMVTALATTGYSLCDHAAMARVHDVYADTLPRVAGSISYMWLQFGMSLIVLSALLWPTAHRPRPKPGRDFLRAAFWVAILNVFTYSLVLMAMMTNKVTYVVGFRQLSVVLGVVLGIVLLHERKGMLGRLIGAGVITAGLVLISIAR